MKPSIGSSALVGLAIVLGCTETRPDGRYPCGDGPLGPDSNLCPSGWLCRCGEDDAVPRCFKQGGVGAPTYGCSSVMDASLPPEDAARDEMLHDAQPRDSLAADGGEAPSPCEGADPNRSAVYITALRDTEGAPMSACMSLTYDLEEITAAPVESAEFDVETCAFTRVRAIHMGPGLTQYEESGVYTSATEATGQLIYLLTSPGGASMGYCRDYFDVAFRDD